MPGPSVLVRSGGGNRGPIGVGARTERGPPPELLPHRGKDLARRRLTIPRPGSRRGIQDLEFDQRKGALEAPSPGLAEKRGCQGGPLGVS